MTQNTLTQYFVSVNTESLHPDAVDDAARSAALDFIDPSRLGEPIRVVRAEDHVERRPGEFVWLELAAEEHQRPNSRTYWLYVSE